MNPKSQYFVQKTTIFWLIFKSIWNLQWCRGCVIELFKNWTFENSELCVMVINDVFVEKEPQE